MNIYGIYCFTPSYPSIHLHSGGQYKLFKVHIIVRPKVQISPENVNNLCVKY